LSMPMAFSVSANPVKSSIFSRNSFDFSRYSLTSPYSRFGLCMFRATAWYI